MTLLYADSLTDRFLTQRYEASHALPSIAYVASRHADDSHTVPRFDNVNSTGRYLTKTFTATATVSFGMAWQFRNANTLTRWHFMELRNGATQLLWLEQTAGGALALVDGSGVIESVDGVILPDTWYHFAITANFDTGDVTVRVDGAVVITVTGGTWAASVCDRAMWSWSANSGASTAQVRMQDLTITDGDDLGDARVVRLDPNAVGAHEDWTPSTAGDNYPMVAGIPANLTNLVTTDTNGHRDSHGLANLPTDAARPDVAGVCVNVLAAKTDAADREIAGAVRVGTTDYTATARVVASSVDQHEQFVWAQDPATSAAWTKAAVDAVEGGYVATKP